MLFYLFVYYVSLPKQDYEFYESKYFLTFELCWTPIALDRACHSKHLVNVE